MKFVEIYTDGACSGNPGPGGWGAVLLYHGRSREISGGADSTTNQRMELTAAIQALKALKEPCRVRLYSDSAYLINAFKLGWLDKWQQNGWRNVKGHPVQNLDLWQELVALTSIHQIEWVKVKGHADNHYNNKCDQLAKAAIKEV